MEQQIVILAKQQNIPLFNELVFYICRYTKLIYI